MVMVTVGFADPGGGGDTTRGGAKSAPGAPAQLSDLGEVTKWVWTGEGTISDIINNDVNVLAGLEFWYGSGNRNVQEVTRLRSSLRASKGKRKAQDFNSGVLQRADSVEECARRAVVLSMCFSRLGGAFEPTPEALQAMDNQIVDAVVSSSQDQSLSVVVDTLPNLVESANKLIGDDGELSDPAKYPAHTVLLTALIAAKNGTMSPRELGVIWKAGKHLKFSVASGMSQSPNTKIDSMKTSPKDVPVRDFFLLRNLENDPSQERVPVPADFKADLAAVRGSHLSRCLNNIRTEGTNDGGTVLAEDLEADRAAVAAVLSRLNAMKRELRVDTYKELEEAFDDYFKLPGTFRTDSSIANGDAVLNIVKDCSVPLTEGDVETLKQAYQAISMSLQWAGYNASESTPGTSVLGGTVARAAEWVVGTRPGVWSSTSPRELVERYNALVAPISAQFPDLGSKQLQTEDGAIAFLSAATGTLFGNEGTGERNMSDVSGVLLASNALQPDKLLDRIKKFNEVADAFSPPLALDAGAVREIGLVKVADLVSDEGLLLEAHRAARRATSPAAAEYMKRVANFPSDAAMARETLLKNVVEMNETVDKHLGNVFRNKDIDVHTAIDFHAHFGNTTVVDANKVLEGLASGVGAEDGEGECAGTDVPDSPEGTRVPRDARVAALVARAGQWLSKRPDQASGIPEHLTRVLDRARKWFGQNWVPPRPCSTDAPPASVLGNLNIQALFSATNNPEVPNLFWKLFGPTKEDMALETYLDFLEETAASTIPSDPPRPPPPGTAMSGIIEAVAARFYEVWNSDLFANADLSAWNKYKNEVLPTFDKVVRIFGQANATASNLELMLGRNTGREEHRSDSPIVDRVITIANTLGLDTSGESESITSNAEWLEWAVRTFGKSRWYSMIVSGNFMDQNVLGDKWKGDPGALDVLEADRENLLVDLRAKFNAKVNEALGPDANADADADADTRDKLRSRVVAEGIETEEHLKHLEDRDDKDRDDKVEDQVVTPWYYLYRLLSENAVERFYDKYWPASTGTVVPPKEKAEAVKKSLEEVKFDDGDDDVSAENNNIRSRVRKAEEAIERGGRARAEKFLGPERTGAGVLFALSVRHKTSPESADIEASPFASALVKLAVKSLEKTFQKFCKLDDGAKPAVKATINTWGQVARESNDELGSHAFWTSVMNIVKNATTTYARALFNAHVAAGIGDEAPIEVPFQPEQYTLGDLAFGIRYGAWNDGSTVSINGDMCMKWGEGSSQFEEWNTKLTKVLPRFQWLTQQKLSHVRNYFGDNDGSSVLIMNKDTYDWNGGLSIVEALDAYDSWREILAGDAAADEKRLRSACQKYIEAIDIIGPGTSGDLISVDGDGDDSSTTPKRYRVIPADIPPNLTHAEVASLLSAAESGATLMGIFKRSWIQKDVALLRPEAMNIDRAVRSDAPTDEGSGDKWDTQLGVYARAMTLACAVRSDRRDVITPIVKCNVTEEVALALRDANTKLPGPSKVDADSKLAFLGGNKEEVKLDASRVDSNVSGIEAVIDMCVHVSKIQGRIPDAELRRYFVYRWDDDDDDDDDGEADGIDETSIVDGRLDETNKGELDLLRNFNSHSFSEWQRQRQQTDDRPQIWGDLENHTTAMLTTVLPALQAMSSPGDSSFVEMAFTYVNHMNRTSTGGSVAAGGSVVADPYADDPKQWAHDPDVSQRFLAFRVRRIAQVSGVNDHRFGQANALCKKPEQDEGWWERTQKFVYKAVVSTVGFDQEVVENNIKKNPRATLLVAVKMLGESVFNSHWNTLELETSVKSLSGSDLVMMYYFLWNVSRTQKLAQTLIDRYKAAVDRVEASHLYGILVKWWFSDIADIAYTVSDNKEFRSGVSRAVLGLIADTKAAGQSGGGSANAIMKKLRAMLSRKPQWRGRTGRVALVAAIEDRREGKVPLLRELTYDAEMFAYLSHARKTAVDPTRISPALTSGQRGAPPVPRGAPPHNGNLTSAQAEASGSAIAMPAAGAAEATGSATAVPAVSAAASGSVTAVPAVSAAASGSVTAVPAVSAAASGSAAAVPAVSAAASGSVTAVPAVSAAASGSVTAVPAVSAAASGSAAAVPAVSAAASGSAAAVPAVSAAASGSAAAAPIPTDAAAASGSAAAASGSAAAVPAVSAAASGSAAAAPIPTDAAAASGSAAAVPAVSAVASGSAAAAPAVSAVASGSAAAAPSVSAVASGSAAAVPADAAAASGSAAAAPGSMPAVSAAASGSATAVPGITRQDENLEDLTVRGAKLLDANKERFWKGGDGSAAADDRADATNQNAAIIYWMIAWKRAMNPEDEGVSTPPRDDATTNMGRWIYERLEEISVSPDVKVVRDRITRDNELRQSAEKNADRLVSAVLSAIHQTLPREASVVRQEGDL